MLLDLDATLSNSPIGALPNNIPLVYQNSKGPRRIQDPAESCKSNRIWCRHLKLFTSEGFAFIREVLSDQRNIDLMRERDFLLYSQLLSKSCFQADNLAVDGHRCC